MVSHIRYCQQGYRSPAECLEGIRLFLARGWWVSSLEGSLGAGYLVTFGVDNTPLASSDGAR
jgi:predicted methyltransferase